MKIIFNSPRIGQVRSWAVVAAILGLAVARPLGCIGGGDIPDADPAVTAVLTDVWPEVLEPTLQRAHTAADALVTTTIAWRDASDPTAGPERDAAKAAWIDVMTVWQEAEVLQVGPAAPSLTAVAGADLRDAAYSWPTTNPCRVDQVTVTGEYDATDFFDTHLVNVYGLDALETVLFGGEQNACDASVDINADGTWTALGADGLAAHRAEYAVVLATGVRDTIATIEDAWRPEGGAFTDALAAAGTDASPYEAQAEALNAVTDALFYVESRTKDDKLGDPLGLGTCTADCADDVETPLSGTSHLWLRANLAGFRALFTGGGGQGLDDLLRAQGHGDDVDAMLTALDAADAAALALDVPVDEAANGDPTDAVALHTALGDVTDRLRAITATLVLQVPSDAAGDND